MIISIDHGNNQIKIENDQFICGYKKTLTEPASGDYIYYKNAYYCLTKNKFPFEWDKTLNEHYYILTLIAIGKKLLQTEKVVVNEQGDIGIHLLVGLPPDQYAQQRENFAGYFRRNSEPVQFSYSNGIEKKEYRIVITDVSVYIQGFAAAMAQFEQLKRYPKIYVVDIGGQTVDWCLLEYGNITQVNSIYYGINFYYGNVSKEIFTAYGISINRDDIDKILDEFVESEDLENGFKEKTVFRPEVKQAVYDFATTYVEEILGKLKEDGADLQTGKPYFICGGALRMRPFITSQISNMNPEFGQSIYANVIGYLFLHNIEAANQTK